MSIFTAHQRAILRRRIAYALRWNASAKAYRDEALTMADAVLDELEMSGFSAAAQRRAVEKVVERLEEVA